MAERKTYEKPELRKQESLKKVTHACPDYSCSFYVPPYEG